MRIETVQAPGAPEPLAYYSQGVIAGEAVFIAGQIASDYQTGVPPEARRAVQLNKGSDIAEQTTYVLRNLQAVAEAGGASIDRIARAQVFLKDAADFAGMDRAWSAFFEHPPPRTTVVVGGHGLLVPGTLVEIDWWASDTGATDMELISASEIAVPLASYSTARRMGPLVHVAGRMALTPNGSIAPAAEVDRAFPFYAESSDLQTRFILDEAAALMATWDGDLNDVVSVQIYMRDLGEYDLCHEAIVAAFETLPAMTVMQVGDLLSDDALIEIELTAVHPDHRGDVRRHHVPEGWLPEGVPDAAQIGDLLLLSGVTAMESAPGSGSPYLAQPISRQTELVVDRIERVLEEAGSALDHVVKTQAFLRDLDDFHRYDRVWRRRFDVLPPRTTVQSGPQGFLDPSAILQVGVVAVTS